MDLNILLIDEVFLPAAKALVSMARRSIYISTFKAEITSKPRGRKLSRFFDNICQQKMAGLDVRLLINTTTPRGSIPLSNSYAIAFLKKNRVAVRILPHERTCHAKLIIVDNWAVIFGSHNLSVKSCHNNFEVSYITHDKTVVAGLIDVYENVWNNAKTL